MKIALVVPIFPQLSETFIVNKFLGLVGRGWNVHIVCQKSPSTGWRQSAALHGRSRLRRRVHAGWPHRPRALAGLLLPLAVLRCLLRRPAATLRYLARGTRTLGVGVIRRLYLDAELLCLEPDVIHFEFGALAVDRMDLADLLGARIVVSFRGLDLNFVGLAPEGSDGHYAPVWRHAAALHLLGQDLWRRAQERGCPADKPHALIPPAIDTDFFDPERFPDREPTPAAPLRILSVARLEAKKGFEFALAAVRLLHEQGIDCEYRIVGTGSYLGALTFARHQMGLEKIVHFLGALPPEGVREEMAGADVLLHAAVSEGFCNAVLEAQAMALPVVASDAGGLPENVVDGKTGFVTPRRDPGAMAEKLRQLAQDPNLRKALGAAGRSRVAESFQLQQQIAAFERLYRCETVTPPRRQEMPRQDSCSQGL